MIEKYYNIILFLLSLLSCNAFSQTNCTVPAAPLFTSVSVQPENGKTDFTWNLSPSSDIAAYILYTYKNGDGMSIDTIWDPLATTFTYSSTATKYFSVSYVITAHRLSVVPGLPGCTSPLSNVLSTIFCNSEIDTCNKKIIVRWNKYADYPKQVKEYQILVSVNGGPYSGSFNSSASSDSYTISDFTIDSQYCVVVRAVFEDGTDSKSNKSCLSTKMQKPPEWINADQASVTEDKEISLSFTIDPLSGINLFSLEKKTGPAGIFQETARLNSENGKVLFSDTKADINKVNYYRLSAINSCNLPVIESNLCSNMALSLDKAGDNLVLTWNYYNKWLGTVLDYRLFVNSGKGFQEIAVIPAADTTYTLGYNEIMYKVSGGEICFYIQATETSNPHGITGQSLSSRFCISPTELVTVPNVFTPDNDLLNDLFRPVLSFTPLDYHLIISDRKGSVLFETRDYLEEWDGSKNGNPQPADVYLWFLKMTTPSGKNISKTGTITIFKNR